MDVAIVGVNMPFLYVYSPSDFIGGLPDESGAAAAGTAPFTLQLVPGATPTLIEVTDEEAIFDEVDATQSLTGAETIDGATYGAGTTINTAYDLINSGTGHKVTSFHFGGDGYQQGAVDGIASTVELVEGTTYTFDTERTSHQKNNQYTDYFACFAETVRIETDRGFVAAGHVKVGDRVMTLDRGYKPVRAVLRRRLEQEELRMTQDLRPIRILAGALGDGLPLSDVLVSPQHRFMTVSPIAQRMFGTAETLISAKKLTALPGIYVDTKVEAVTYVHLVLDAHEIILAEGAPTESFFCGPIALAAIGEEAREELLTLFPELRQPNEVGAFARPVAAGRLQKRMVARHKKNKKPIVASSDDV